MFSELTTQHAVQANPHRCKVWGEVELFKFRVRLVESGDSGISKLVNKQGIFLLNKLRNIFMCILLYVAEVSVYLVFVPVVSRSGWRGERGWCREGGSLNR